jgi:hypothetical protein
MTHTTNLPPNAQCLWYDCQAYIRVPRGKGKAYNLDGSPHDHPDAPRFRIRYLRPDEMELFRTAKTTLEAFL